MPQPQQGIGRRKGAAPKGAAADNVEDGVLLCCSLLTRPVLLIAAFLLSITVMGHLYSELNSSGPVAAARNNSAADKAPIRVKQKPLRKGVADVLDKAVEASSKKTTGHSLAIQQSTLDHLQSLGDFPKIIHLIWSWDKNILDKDYEILEHGAKNLRRLNPTWKFIVHDENSINKAIAEFRHPDIPASMNDDLKSAHIVEKTDAFRLIKIFSEGGLYDDDVEYPSCSLVSMASLCPSESIIIN